MKLFSLNQCRFGSFFAVLILTAACIAQAGADDDYDPNVPQKLLKKQFDAVFSILQNENLDQQAKEMQICDIASPLFDFKLMAKLALGRKNWPKLNETQQEKFIELFTEKLKESYRKKLSLYSDEKVLFKKKLVVEKTMTVNIPVNLVSDEKTIEMLYMFRRVKKQWKIYDVRIEGISILMVYRSQFDDILSHSTIEDLLAQMEK